MHTYFLFCFQEFIKSAFQDIVSDELKKIKDSSISDCLDIPTSDPKSDDLLWEYNGLQDAYEGDCEEMLLQMQRIFYEDLRAESTRTGNISLFLYMQSGRDSWFSGSADNNLDYPQLLYFIIRFSSAAYLAVVL